MIRRWCVLLLIALAPAVTRADTAADLRRQCDELIAAAVKRPYGWAWPAADAPAEPTPDARPARPARSAATIQIPVTLEPRTTPAAGLVLWHASQVLNEPRYAQAARHVARALAASQHPLGKFPSTATFNATSVGTKEDLRPLPDRAPTRAALALLLTLTDEDADKPEAAPRAAARAAAWLLKQQVESGAWPVRHPADVPPHQAARIVRLDTPDTRDSVMSTLLAYEVLGDPFQRRSAERAAEFLIKARYRTAADVGAGLWQTAYTPAAAPVDPGEDFPQAIDSRASRHATEAILAVYVVLADGQRLIACEVASDSIEKLAKENDWRPRYTYKGQVWRAPTVETGAFAPATPEEPPPDDQGWVRTARLTRFARDAGREKFVNRVRAVYTPRQQWAIAIAGLSDGPLMTDLPTAKEEIEPFLKRTDARLRQLSKDESGLSSQVRGVWVTCLRAKLERALAAE